MAAILLCMTCPACEGTGTGKKGARCECRAFGHEVALKALRDEGLVE